jgi:hypothetical protein
VHRCRHRHRNGVAHLKALLKAVSDIKRMNALKAVGLLPGHAGFRIIQDNGGNCRMSCIFLKVEGPQVPYPHNTDL